MKANLPAVAVGPEGAAEMLNTSAEHIRQLVGAGLLATIPNFSTDRKLQIAVVEIERFAACGMTRTATGLKVVS